jgi:hypothetical protein
MPYFYPEYDMHAGGRKKVNDTIPLNAGIGSI